MKRLIPLFMCLILSLSSSAHASLASWLVNDLNSTKAKILRTWGRVCSWAPSACGAWTGKALGIYVLGPDGAAIYRSTSTSAVDFAPWVQPGGCWSYDGGSWCASAAGTGNRYTGSLCSRSWQPYGIIAAKAVSDGGSVTYAAPCNFSPSVSFPRDQDPTWFNSNVCGPGYSNTSWATKHEITFSGGDNRRWAVLVCNQTNSYGTFSEFSSITLTGPWPETSFDNRQIIQDLSSGLSAMLASDDPFVQSQGEYYAADVADSIDVLKNGLTVSGGVETNSFFSNPFSSIDESGSYVVSVSSVYVVGISSIVVDVNVVSSVSVNVPGLDGVLSLFDSTTDYLEEYEFYSSTASYHFGALKDIMVSISSTVASVFHFEGVPIWDGCFTFSVGDTSVNGSTLDCEDSIFCFSSIPGWDSFALPLLRAILMLGTFISCLWWLFD